jgi:hypothetical protein
VTHHLNPIGEGIDPQATDPAERIKVIVTQSTASELSREVVHSRTEHSESELALHDQGLRLQVLALGLRDWNPYDRDMTVDERLAVCDQFYDWIVRGSGPRTDDQ